MTWIRNRHDNRPGRTENQWKIGPGVNPMGNYYCRSANDSYCSSLRANFAISGMIFRQLRVKCTILWKMNYHFRLFVSKKEMFLIGRYSSKWSKSPCSLTLQGLFILDLQTPRPATEPRNSETPKLHCKVRQMPFWTPRRKLPQKSIKMSRKPVFGRPKTGFLDILIDFWGHFFSESKMAFFGL